MFFANATYSAKLSDEVYLENSILRFKHKLYHMT